MKLRIVKIDVRDAEKLSNKTRIYIFPKGETILENLLKRHDRPHKAYKPVVLDELCGQGILPQYVKISWSQKAGCSCGCSPGFVVESERGKEIFIDIEEVA